MVISRRGLATVIALAAVVGIAQVGASGTVQAFGLPDAADRAAGESPDGAADAQAADGSAETFAVIATERGPLSYEFTVDGNVSKTRIHDRVGASSNDAITDHGNGTVTVAGFTGNPGYGDAYEIEGEVASFAVTGGDAAFELYRGGEHVTDEWVADQSDYPTVFEVITTETGEASYAFTVDGNVSVTATNGTVGAETVNDEIVERDDGTTRVEGFTGNPGYGDAYVIEGEVTSFERTGGNASVERFRDGERVTGSGTTSVERVWNHSLDGHFTDGAADVARAPDGGYLVAGTSVTADGSSAATVVKLSANGTTAWTSVVGEPCNQTVTAVEAAGPDQFVVTGTTTNGTDENAWVARGTADGDLVWSRSLGAGGNDSAEDVARTDGGFVVAGEFADRYQYGWLVNVTDDGEVVWDRTYESGVFDTVTPTDSGGYAVGGITDSYPSPAAPFAAWFVLTDDDGTEVANSTPSGHFASDGRDVVQTGSDRYALVGWGEPLEAYVAHVNGSGGATSVRSYRGHYENPYAAGATSAVANGDGSVLAALTPMGEGCGLVEVGPDGTERFRTNVSTPDGPTCELASGSDDRYLLVTDSEAIVLETDSAS